MSKESPVPSFSNDIKGSIEHVEDTIPSLEGQRKKRFSGPEERQAALEEAIKRDPVQMCIITFIICCCSGDSGFDSTVMGGINGMHQFQEYFGMTGAGTKTSFGRRFSMFFGNCILICGAVITANAKSMSMFLGGRWMTGFGCTCAATSAKSYLAEIVPPRTRGAYLGFLNSFYYVGQMSASGMMVATNLWPNELSWRLPLYIQTVPAAINALFVFTCPESPRWLASIGKHEQARKLLAKFHSQDGNINSPVIEIEMDEIKEKIEINGRDKRWWDFRPLFRTRSDRYRSYMCIIIGAFGQLSGNGLITYFLPILIKNAGIQSQSKQQTLNFINSVTSYIGVDRFGRRKNLFWATFTITCILAIVTGLLSQNGNATRSNAGISFIFLFMVCFSFGWTPMQALYPAEVLSYEARAKGLAFLNLVTQAASLINTFGLPVALEKIGWKTYVIFVAWDAFECVIIYFFIVETKYLTLEEIGEVFEQPNPVQYSKELYRRRATGGNDEEAHYYLQGKPTSKTSESGQNGRFAYAVSEMQGWRITMEDAHAIVLDLDENAEEPNAFFAVYDGHGGGTVAKFAGQNVHKRLISEEAYQGKDYETALKKAFLGTDEDLLANPAHARDPSGCTAVAALVTKDKIYVANAGDSRSVLSVKGEAKPLSFDHKPTNETEKARITGAGGYVEYGRVNGNLALSRAIGDFDFKKNYSLSPEKQVITSNPDVTVHDIGEEDEFIVLACDGIWDCLTSQQVMDFIRLQVSEGKELAEIAELMCDHCLAPDTSSGAGIGCDNMTVLIAAILHGRTKEEWYAWITDRVKNGYGYNTPSTIPQLYATSRLMSFKARREAQEARERQRTEVDDNGVSAFLESSGLSGFARVLGSTGGISFHPGSGILSDGRGLMFAGDDSGEEDDSGDEGPVGGKGFFTETLGLGAEESSSSSDPIKHLKAQLDEYDWEEDDDSHNMKSDSDSDGDAMNVENTSSPSSTANSSSTSTTVVVDGEAPPPPKDLPNGNAKPASSVTQLKSEPGGDKASAVVEAEGLMDTSEDPLKV
ncbi:protein phosphatase 2c ptc3 [Moniliophthora roreri]|nr:protein phosphatase 2c ptc3 [Moniliophthora roreri]